MQPECFALSESEMAAIIDIQEYVAGFITAVVAEIVLYGLGTEGFVIGLAEVQDGAFGFVGRRCFRFSGYDRAPQYL